MSQDRPLLIVVSGRPGSGKSTLARTLAETIRCPLVSRDEIKEGLMARPTPDLSSHEITRAAFEAFFAAIELLVRRGVSVVAEAGFQQSRWAPKLEPLLPLCDLRIVLCETSAELAHARMLTRELADPSRGRYHPVGPLQTEFVPPDLPVPTLRVDTSDGYRPGLPEIVAFVTA